MAARSAAAAVVVVLLLATVATGAAAASGDDTLDGGLDDNATDATAETTDDDILDDNTTDAIDNTTDSVDDTVENASESVEDGTSSAGETVENTTDSVLDGATNTTGEVTDETTDGVESATETTENATGATVADGATDEVTTVTDRTVAGTQTTLERTTGETATTLDGATDALAGTLSLTGTTVTGVLSADATGADSSVTTGERTESGGDSDASRAASDWTREPQDATADGEATGATARADSESTASPRPGPRRLPVPEGAAATTAFVAGVVAVARPPAVTPNGASPTGTVAARRLTAGFDRLKRFLVPLRYSRYDDSDPLDHEARAALYDAIEREPGVYLSELCERADVNLSTARHHVRVLEDEDLVASAKPRGKRRYYPAAADDFELAAALSEPATAAVLEALADAGEARVGQLAADLDRDPSTVSHHLQRLADDGLVERERRGRAVVNRLADPVADALATRSDPVVADD